jgi:haloacetate dehalogenase
MIAGCPQQYLHAKLGGWGADGLQHIAAEDLAEYERCFMRQTTALECKEASNALGTQTGSQQQQGLAHHSSSSLYRGDIQQRLPSVHAACEDYRASAWNGIDTQHDRHSRTAGQNIRCEVLAAWGEKGVVARLFDVEGLWRAACGAGVGVRGVVLPGVGHFIPEEAPQFTANLLRDFFR